jgi:hypothetical protein
MRLIINRLALLTAAVCVLAPTAAASATSTRKQIKASLASGADYLKAQQQTDGSFGTDWVLGALAATGTAAADVMTSESSTDARTYERELLGDTTTWPGESEPPVTEFDRATLNAYAAGIDPARVSKTQNLIAQIASYYQTANPGYYGPPATFGGTVFALLALAETKTVKGARRVPEALLEKSIAVLRANQHTDGGWTYERAEGSPAILKDASEPDETGAAMAGLCSAGVPNTDPTIVKAEDYLKADLVASTGAFGAPFGLNTDSNAWAVQGLDACGIAAQGSEFTSAQGRTPIDFLIGQQLAGGGFVYEPGEAEANEYSTQDAVRAIAGAGFTTKPAKPKGGAPRWVSESGFRAGVHSLLTLVINNGTSSLKVCSVSVEPSTPTTTLAAVLEAAEAASSPAGCVSSFAPASGSGALTQINGSPSPAEAKWDISIDGGKEKSAKRTSEIALGDTISLHLG